MTKEEAIATIRKEAKDYPNRSAEFMADELVWSCNTDESPDIDTLRAGRPKIEVEVAK